jgi:hypothetical protein
METDLNFFLPHGEILRTQLVNPELTSGNLKGIIKSKGIFLSSYEKIDTIPVLMRSILSPEEYSAIADLKKQRTENVKYRTNQIPWKGDDNLIKSLPKNLDLAALIKEKYKYNPGYTLNNVTSFVPIDGNKNKAEITFSVEEQSDINTIGDRKKIYHGKLMLEIKSDGNLHLSTIKNFTSKSTQDVVNILSKNLESHFKKEGTVDNADSYEQIMFDHFTNEKRFLFFMRFIDSFNLLTIDKIIDISFSPDPNEILPEEAKLLLEDIERLNLRGKSLRKHALLAKEEYRNSILISSMTLRFNYEHIEGNGKCEVEFYFPDFNIDKRDNLEFQFHVQRNTVSRQYRSYANKNKIEQAIYSTIEETKMRQYNKLKK